MTKQYILENGTPDYCSPIYAVQLYKEDKGPKEDVEGAIDSAMELYAKEQLKPYRKIAELISSIFFYGNFKVETPAEKELEEALKGVGLWPTTEDEIISRQTLGAKKSVQDRISNVVNNALMNNEFGGRIDIHKDGVEEFSKSLAKEIVGLLHYNPIGPR